MWKLDSDCGIKNSNKTCDFYPSFGKKLILWSYEKKFINPFVLKNKGWLSNNSRSYNTLQMRKITGMFLLYFHVVVWFEKKPANFKLVHLSLSFSISKTHCISWTVLFFHYCLYLRIFFSLYLSIRINAIHMYVYFSRIFKNTESNWTKFYSF
jgi:hypothetical protein